VNVRNLIIRVIGTLSKQQSKLESLMKIVFYPVKMFCISGQDNHSNRHQGKVFEFLWFIKYYLSLVINKWQIFHYDKPAAGSV